MREKGGAADIRNKCEKKLEREGEAKLGYVLMWMCKALFFQTVLDNVLNPVCLLRISST